MSITDRFDPISLSWLPEPPENFRSLLKSLDKDTNGAGKTVRHLAGYRLNAVQAGALSRKITRLRERGVDLSPLSSFRLTILSNATFDILADALPAAAARHGVSLEIVLSPYDQVLQQCLDPGSAAYASSADAILLAIDHRWFALTDQNASGQSRVAGAKKRFDEALDLLASNGAPPVIVQTLAPAPMPLFGSYDRHVPGTNRDIDALNEHIIGTAKENEAYLLDVARMAESIGTARFHDPVAWNLFKLPMSHHAVLLYVDWVGRLLGAIRGKPRKCLVLDLDNTLWGGEIGDDGLEGIILGNGSGEGEAFLAIQQFALDLRARGIVLAVSSKNEDNIAREPFRSHPEMLLREEHISTFQANWHDKASNIEAIAAALDLGLDSMVFLDDNSVERAQVRAALPDVAVPEVGSDPSLYPLILAAAGYFEAVSFSNEDALRASSYAANAQRAKVEVKARNVDEYLRSLQIRVSHTSFNPTDRSRIAQLINKTNQFNLTTVRLTEAQVAEMETHSAYHTFATRVSDCFGDFGLVGVIAAQARSPDVWSIELWLMSCRVLGRRIEQEMFSALLSEARSHGVTELLARYLPSGRNALVKQHFDNLGFRRVTEADDGSVHYSFDVTKTVTL